MIGFPEFVDTTQKLPQQGSVPVSEVSAIVQRELSKHIVMQTDSWANLLSGLGGKSDKTIRTVHDGVDLVDDATLTGIYMNEGLGGRIVDVVADDMTREWISFLEDENTANDKKEYEVHQELADAMIELDVEERFNEALRMQRLYGGALIVIGAMDGGKLSTPLNLSKIRSVESLKVYDRTDIDIQSSVIDTNPNSPHYGKVLIYTVNTFVGGNYVPLKVHHTRCIEFKNDPCPSSVRSYMDLNHRYWGMSSLQKVFESLRDLGGINQSIASLMYELVVGKFKVAHLAEIMSQPGGSSGIIRRLEIMNMSKSMLNAVLIDSEEDYSRDAANLAGIPEVVDRFMLMVSGSSGIPVTRLFGRSPGGLNSTGENDLRNYYDLVESAQRNKLQKPIKRLVAILCAAHGIKDIPKFEFNSLYQMTEIEIAEQQQRIASTKQTEANTMMTFVNMGALDADEVRKDYLNKKGSVKPEEVEAPENYSVGGDPRKQPMSLENVDPSKGTTPMPKLGGDVKIRAKA
jgi:phage-related protein (TIGR01555 family)